MTFDYMEVFLLIHNDKEYLSCIECCKALLLVILTGYSEQLVVTFTKPCCFPTRQGCMTHVLRPKSQELGTSLLRSVQCKH